jgi:hypothetical protein
MTETPQNSNAGINPTDLFNYYLGMEQNNVLECIRALEYRKEKRIDPFPARMQLNVNLKLLVLRMEPFLKTNNKNREEILKRIKVCSNEGIVELYTELAEIINLNTNRKVLL